MTDENDMSANGLLRGSGGAPDFDHPLEMLAACHERIEDRCDLLHRLVAHLALSGCDEQARQAAASVLRYFDTAGEHHHQDEEHDVFPALLEKDPAASAALVAALRADHIEMRAAWRRLRGTLARIAEASDAEPGAPDKGAGTLDVGAVTDFTSLHRNHIAREEAELLPLAQGVLGDDKLQAIGAAMAQRRGVAR